MKRKKTIWILIPLLIASTSFAKSTGGGNGGDVFICEDPSQNVILDFYEGKEKGMFENFGDPSKSLTENYLKWISLFENVDQSEAASFKESGLNFINDINKILNGEVDRTWLVSFTEDDLLDIPDSEELINPKKCIKHQIAVRTNGRRNNSILIIQKNLWNQIATNQQAILIAHEVVYGRFILKGATDSRDARFFNQEIMSGKFQNMSICNYYNFINFQTSYKNFIFNDITIGDGTIFSTSSISVGEEFRCKDNSIEKYNLNLEVDGYYVPFQKALDAYNKKTFLELAWQSKHWLYYMSGGLGITFDNTKFSMYLDKRSLNLSQTAKNAFPERVGGADFYMNDEFNLKDENDLLSKHIAKKFQELNLLNITSSSNPIRIQNTKNSLFEKLPNENAYIIKNLEMTYSVPGRWLGVKVQKKNIDIILSEKAPSLSYKPKKEMIIHEVNIY